MILNHNKRGKLVSAWLHAAKIRSRSEIRHEKQPHRNKGACKYLPDAELDPKIGSSSYEINSEKRSSMLNKSDQIFPQRIPFLLVLHG